MKAGILLRRIGWFHEVYDSVINRFVQQSIQQLQPAKAVKILPLRQVHRPRFPASNIAGLIFWRLDIDQSDVNVLAAFRLVAMHRDQDPGAGFQ